MQKQKKTKEITLVAMLASIIAISGLFKIPSPFPGTEFQMSAPIAIIIAALFGFKRYLCAGILASAVSILIGAQTIIHVLVAMIFRVVAGGMVSLFGTALIILFIAGPLGTIAARLVLSALLDISFHTLIWASLPGMIFTAIATVTVYPTAVRTMKKTPFRNLLVNHKRRVGIGKYESI